MVLEKYFTNTLIENMQFKITENTTLINNYRQQLYKLFTAPIDGMWESRYIGNTSNYTITIQDTTVGYCCIDEDDTLLQIYVEPESRKQMRNIISALIESKLITSTSLSSIEPIAFNASLLLSKKTKENTYCFQYVSSKNLEHKANLKQASEKEIKNIKTFLLNQIGFADTIGYTESLIQREALYYITEGDIIIATGEYRLSPSQPNIVDLGVIVNKEYRKKGVATNILQTLAEQAMNDNKTPICSTTIDNIASQKAIENAGFYCSHIIFDMEF